MELIVVIVFAVGLIAFIKMKNSKRALQVIPEVSQNHFPSEYLQSVGMHIMILEENPIKDDLIELNHAIGTFIRAIEMAQGIPLRKFLDIESSELGSKQKQIYIQQLTSALAAFTALLNKFAEKPKEEQNDISSLAINILRITIGSAIFDSIAPHGRVIWQILNKQRSTIPIEQDTPPHFVDAIRYIPRRYISS